MAQPCKLPSPNPNPNPNPSPNPSPDPYPGPYPNQGANCSVVATCLFWDGAAAAWSDSGCVKSNTPLRRTDGFVHCRCHRPPCRAHTRPTCDSLLTTYHLLATYLLLTCHSRTRLPPTRCNHLTDFGGVTLPSTPEELLAEFTELTFNTFTLDELVGPTTTPTADPYP